MEHQFFDTFFVYFFGPFFLFGLKWMLNSMLNIFLPDPESLPAPKKIQPEIKLPLPPTKEGASCLQKNGFLPDGIKSMNNPDEITNERQATLMTTELERIKLLRELVKNTDKKLLQLKAAFDVEKFVLMQAVNTWKPCAHAHADQKSHFKQDKQLESYAEEAKYELEKLKETFSKEMAELRALMEDDQASLKLAEGRQRELQDMLVKETQESDDLRTEMSHALANQEALYEETVKQLKLVAEQAKRQLMEVRQTHQEEVMELKVENRIMKEALKSAEEKMKEMEEISLKRTKAAESLANEQTAALTEAVNTLHVAVKHAKDEVLGDSSSSRVEEKREGTNETLENWLIKNGFLTRIPPKTWMELLEHTGFLMEEKLNNLKSKAEMLFHSNKTTQQTE
ncbi:hypothetical protein GHT06_019086 [Daphnia sinensis]|uniref:Uncharacterized protein n=1 Tax=Daphnia sinensis TaxID=1820382 RepID=A0AAD5PNZ3_9CRUS|nr:hypothetical protein GHT06_019086 [Daphnia sinensis]